jgi:LPXTG-motif cell wall-anchored protein
MKKILSFITIIAIILCTGASVYAAGYSFDLQYEGTVTKNVAKDAKVLLIGEAAPTYATVRVKIDVSGPATPKLIATDSLGTQIDISQTGYWGPDAGFPVQGDFVNTTPIVATFPEEGTYTITLSLIDLANADAVIATKSFKIEVFEDLPVVEDVNSIINDVGNTVEELPKTGTSIFDYLMYIVGLTIILTISIAFIKRKTIKA